MLAQKPATASLGDLRLRLLDSANPFGQREVLPPARLLGGEFSVSVTTRKPRPGEANARDYHYITAEEFTRLRDTGGLLEWAEVYGNKYGTPAEPVERATAAGKTIILEIDIQGCIQVRKKRTDAITVFVLPPSSDEQRKRIEGRKTDAESVIAAFRQLDANILVQEYIREAGGADIRALIVGNRVVASMRRQSAPGEFRSNLHRGGTAERIRLTPEERAVAVRAARTMGLNVCGVDLVRSKHGPLVLEVNSSPGLEGIEATSGVDVARRIVEWIEKSHAAQPRRTRNRA